MFDGIVNASDTYVGDYAFGDNSFQYALDIGNSNDEQISYWNMELEESVTDTTLTTAGIIQMKGDAPPIDDGGDDDDTGGIIVIDDPIVRTILSIMPILVIIGLIFTAVWELGLTNSFRRN